jgi:hypothetical protein
MKPIKDGSKWGDWTLDTKALSLDLYSDRHSYSIDLTDITDSARMLDWIFQIQLKTWSTNEIIGDLISAFQDIYRPQGSLCGQGISKTIDPKALIENA